MNSTFYTTVEGMQDVSWSHSHILLYCGVEEVSITQSLPPPPFDSKAQYESRAHLYTKVEKGVRVIHCLHPTFPSTLKGRLGVGFYTTVE